MAKQKLRGKVTLVEQDTFIADLHEKQGKSYSENPVYVADFSKSELGRRELDYLEEGAIAEVELDEAANTFSLRLKPKPTATDAEWKAAWREACEMLAELEDDEDTREAIRSMKPWPNPHRPKPKKKKRD